MGLVRTCLYRVQVLCRAQNRGSTGHQAPDLHTRKGRIYRYIVHTGADHACSMRVYVVLVHTGTMYKYTQARAFVFFWFLTSRSAGNKPRGLAAAPIVLYRGAFKTLLHALARAFQQANVPKVQVDTLQRYSFLLVYSCGMQQPCPSSWIGQIFGGRSSAATYT